MISEIQMPLHALRYLLLTGLVLLGPLGCPAHTRMAPQLISELESALEGQTRTLQVSCYVGPFFRDARYRLLIDRPPASVDLMRGPGGERLSSGAADGILPAGTEIRILDVQLPTATVVTGRSLMTPRTLTWILLAVPGSSTPHVLLFRDDPPTREGFEAMLERYLGSQEMRATLAALHPDVQQAVKEKRLVAGMRSDTARMAWGYPLRLTRSMEAGMKRERWVFEGGAVVEVENDHVKAWQMPPPAPPP